MRTIVHLFCDVYLSLKSLQKVHKHCIIIILKEFVLVMAQKKNKMQLQDIRYEFEIDLASLINLNLMVSDPPIIPLDMFFESQKVFIFSSDGGQDEKIGEGYIYSSVRIQYGCQKQKVIGIVSIFNLTGTTDWIREMQNILAGKKNHFVTNTMGLEELLASVKAIKKDVEDLLNMLDAIIELLNIQIDFDGAIWAKFVREENYDQTALANGCFG